MSIEDAARVDGLGIAKRDGYLALTISDHVSWDDVLLDGLWRDRRIADERISQLDGQIHEAAKVDSDARRLQQLHGVGPVVATALIACVGDARQFASGCPMARHLA